MKNKKLIWILFLFISLFLFVNSVNAIVIGPLNWPMYGLDLNHSSWDYVRFPLMPGSELQATFVTSGNALSSPVVANGYVYVTSVGNTSHGYLYQLNASNISQQINNFSSTNNIVSSPILVGGFVYFNDEGYIYQLNASNISQSITAVRSGNIPASPIISDGYYYVNTEDYFSQHNASNISKLIAFVSSESYMGRPTSSPVVANGYMYVGSLANFFQLNASNISRPVVATFHVTPIFTNFMTSSPVVANGFVYFGSDQDFGIFQLNASNVSQKIASFSLPNGHAQSFPSSPVVANGFVYFGGNDGYFYQLDASNISRPVVARFYATHPGGWGDSVKYSSPVISDGMVYFSAGNYVFVLNASDVSQQIHNFSTISYGQAVIPTVVGGGLVYVGAGNHLLQFRNPYLIDSKYPSFFNYVDNSGINTTARSALATFNVTVINSTGQVYLTIDGRDMLATSLGSDIYTVSLTLSAGSYSYYWSARGLGSDSNLGTSPTHTFLISTTTLSGWTVDRGSWSLINNMLNGTSNSTDESVIYSSPFDLKANTDYTLSIAFSNPNGCSATIAFGDADQTTNTDDNFAACTAASLWNSQSCFPITNQNKLSIAEGDLGSILNTTINIRSNGNVTPEGYFKDVKLRITVDEDCPNGILFDNVSLREIDVLNAHFDESMQGFASGCCPGDYCWNGASCVSALKWVENSTYPPVWNAIFQTPWNDSHINNSARPVARGYRCVLDENNVASWQIANIKYDWNFKESGYCPRDDECFVGFGDNARYIHNFTFFNTTTSCVSDGEIVDDNFQRGVGNHYCYQGNWTTKTYVLATFLQNITAGNDFVLFCDNTTNALNTPMTNIVGACTLIQQDGTVVVGALFANASQDKLNTFIDTANEIYGPAFISDAYPGIPPSLPTILPLPEGGCDVYETGFWGCNSPDGRGLYLYYNPQWQYVLISKNPITAIEGESFLVTLWDVIRNFFTRLFGTVPESPTYEYIHYVSNYDKVYLVKNHSLSIVGIQEAKYDEYNQRIQTFIYLNYTGVNTSMNTLDWKYLNKTANINMTNTSTSQDIIIKFNQTKNLWPYLTAMLRDREIVGYDSTE